MKKLTLSTLLGLSLVACAPTQVTPTTATTTMTPTTPTGPGIVRTFDGQTTTTTTTQTTAATATTTTTPETPAATAQQTTATTTTTPQDSATTQTTATTATTTTTPETPAATAQQTTATTTTTPQDSAATQTTATTATTTTTPETPAATAQATATQTTAPVPVTTAPATEGGWLTVQPASTERRTEFGAAEQVIDPAREYRAVLKTTKGDIVLNLDDEAAPLAVNNFVFLALNHFYDGTRFHRVIDGFMAQGGDPQSADVTRQAVWGTGGPGYTFANEQSNLTFDKAGVLAMANAGRDTNGSQFFITFGPATFLNGDYTIFGQVADGMDVLNSLTRTMTGNNTPIAGVQPDIINTVEIQAR